MKISKFQGLMSLVLFLPSLAGATEGLAEYHLKGNAAEKMMNVLLANGVEVVSSDSITYLKEPMTTIEMKVGTLECMASRHTNIESLEMFSELFTARYCVARKEQKETKIDTSVYFLIDSLKGLQGDAAMGKWITWVDQLSCTATVIQKSNGSFKKSYSCMYLGDE